MHEGASLLNSSFSAFVAIVVTIALTALGNGTVMRRVLDWIGVPDFPALGMTRDEVIHALHGHGIGTQVHYIPLYRQPYFKARYGPMRLPGAEAFYAAVLALPLFPAMTDEDQARVVAALGALSTG